MIRSNSPPIFAKDCIVMTNVLKIKYIDFPPRLSNLRSLRILNALNKDTPLKARFELRVTTAPRTDPRATMKSKRFHGSLM